MYKQHSTIEKTITAPSAELIFIIFLFPEKSITPHSVTKNTAPIILFIPKSTVPISPAQAVITQSDDIEKTSVSSLTHRPVFLPKHELIYSSQLCIRSLIQTLKSACENNAKTAHAIIMPIIPYLPYLPKKLRISCPDANPAPTIAAAYPHETLNILPVLRMTKHLPKIFMQKNNAIFRRIPRRSALRFYKITFLFIKLSLY
jgi:hypothetical protein